jgi:multisubunit Na+/H+ antiporter MnhB subunit
VRWDRSQILDTGLVLLFPTTLLLSLFLLFAGHNAPGGGFIGGLVAGAGFVLKYVAGGTPELRSGVSVAPPVLLGTGLTIAVATGAVPWIVGGGYLESDEMSAQLPLLGEIHTTSSLVFDIGVYLVVVGLVLTVLRTIGAEPLEEEPLP